MIPVLYTRGEEVYVFFPADHAKGLNSKYIKCVILELKTKNAGSVFAGPRYSVQTREANEEREIQEGKIFDDVPQNLMRTHPPTDTHETD